MALHKEGKATIVIASLLSIITIALAWAFLPTPYKEIVTVVTMIPFIIVVNFFRKPHRNAVRVDGAIVAPCDGTVVAIEECYEPEVIKEQCLQVSIFMSVTNVHINWFPVKGTIEYYRHHDGKKMAAWLPKSSTDNERSSVVIKMGDGRRVLVRQVAGAMARRVVTYAQEGQEVEQSSEMGFIKFGSRVDMYLPLGTKIDAHLKDKTVGAQTIMGWLK